MHTLMCQLYQQGLWVMKAYELRFWLHSANHSPTTLTSPPPPNTKHSHTLGSGAMAMRI